MNRLPILLGLCVWCIAGVARATPEDARACVAASTDGQTERDEGHLLAAREKFLGCLEDTCPAIVRKSCSDWLAALEPRIPSVVLRVDEDFHGEIANARATVDGTDVALDGRALPLDPGKHTVVVSAPGWLPVERSLLLAEREQGRLVVIRLEHREVPVLRAPRMVVAPAQREPVPPPTPVRHYQVPVMGWVLGGVGVAGITTFGVLYSQARHDLDDLDWCKPNCSQSDADKGNRKTLIADVSLGVGIGALAGAGAWMLGSWLARRNDTPQDRRTFLLLPTRGGALAGIAASY